MLMHLDIVTNQDLGVFTHPVLAVNPEDGFILGTAPSNYRPDQSSRFGEFLGGSIVQISGLSLD